MKILLPKTGDGHERPEPCIYPGQVKDAPTERCDRTTGRMQARTWITGGVANSGARVRVQQEQDDHHDTTPSARWPLHFGRFLVSLIWSVVFSRKLWPLQRVGLLRLHCARGGLPWLSSIVVHFLRANRPPGSKDIQASQLLYYLFIKDGAPQCFVNRQ